MSESSSPSPQPVRRWLTSPAACASWEEVPSGRAQRFLICSPPNKTAKDRKLEALELITADLPTADLPTADLPAADLASPADLETPGSQEWKEWKWDLMNRMPSDKAARILGTLKKAEQRAEQLQADLESQGQEAKRLAAALEEARERERRLLEEQRRMNAEVESARLEADCQMECVRAWKSLGDFESTKHFGLDDPTKQPEHVPKDFDKSDPKQIPSLTKLATPARAQGGRFQHHRAASAGPTSLLWQNTSGDEPPVEMEHCSGVRNAMVNEVQGLLARRGSAAATATELAMAAWSCGTFKTCDTASLKALAERLADGYLSDLAPRGVCDVAWAFSELNICNFRLERAISWTATQRLEEFNAEEVGELRSAIVKQVKKRGRDNESPEGYCQALVDMLTSALDSKAPYFSPRGPMTTVAPPSSPASLLNTERNWAEKLAEVDVEHLFANAGPAPAQERPQGRPQPKNHRQRLATLHGEIRRREMKPRSASCGLTGFRGVSLVSCFARK